MVILRCFSFLKRTVYIGQNVKLFPLKVSPLPEHQIWLLLPLTFHEPRDQLSLKEVEENYMAATHAHKGTVR